MVEKAENLGLLRLACCWLLVARRCGLPLAACQLLLFGASCCEAVAGCWLLGPGSQLLGFPSKGPLHWDTLCSHPQPFPSAPLVLAHRLLTSTALS